MGTEKSISTDDWLRPCTALPNHRVAKKNVASPRRPLSIEIVIIKFYVELAPPTVVLVAGDGQHFPSDETIAKNLRPRRLPQIRPLLA